MTRTTNGFDTMSQASFIETLNVITGKMTGNTNFPDQQAAATALNTEKDAFLILAEKATHGSKADSLTRDASRQSITIQLRNLGNEVTAVSKGDIIKLESSGFSFSKDKQPTPPLVKPVAPKLTAGVNSGEIECAAKKQAGNESINYMLSTDPLVETNWKIFTSSKSKFLFSNLVSGQRYYVKYTLVGVRDQEVVSDMVSYISQ